MANEQQSQAPPRGIRFLVRIWGFIAALSMISTGLFVLITVSKDCLLAAILQITCGLIVLPLEVPVLCSQFEMLIKMSDWVESHFKFWMRGFLYMLFGVPPIALCFELSTIVGSGAVVVLAVFYGVMSIGKKGADTENSSPKGKSSDDVELKEKLMTSNGEPNDLSGY